MFLLCLWTSLSTARLLKANSRCLARVQKDEKKGKEELERSLKPRTTYIARMSEPRGLERERYERWVILAL